MKRYRCWIILHATAVLCSGGAWLTLQVTAEHPALGDPVSYPVNQVDGFELTIEEPSWSPFKGYTIRWKVTANSEDVYAFSIDGNDSEPDFSYLEQYADGQWHRLQYSQDDFGHNDIEFLLGRDESTSLEGSVVQKYDYYGTRLEQGNYRLVLKMTSEDGTPHYLASEFAVE